MTEKRVVFATPGELDLNAVRLVGVSVKSAGSIGRFGTGLKYAIAVLLRTGHTIRILTGGQEHRLSSGPVTVRGQQFSRVVLSGPDGVQELGFTVEMGRDWEVWMAYRELMSNTMDERGWTEESAPSETPDPAVTRIEVVGAGIVKIHQERHSIFVDESVRRVANTANMDIRPGPSSWVFYRGVRVHLLMVPSLYQYNLLGSLELTEDRTARSGWDVEYQVSRELALVTEDTVARTISRAREGRNWEHSLPFHFHSSSLSPEMAQAARSVLRSSEAPRNLVLAGSATLTIEEQCVRFELTEDEASVVEAALRITDQISTSIREMQIVWSESLGGPLAVWDETTTSAYVTREILCRGESEIAGTLYEEWLHSTTGVRDHSRRMQDILIAQSVTLARRLAGVADE